MNENINSKYPEFYYKYKKYSPHALKELCYGEIYFAERSELNDPFDTKIPYLFRADFGKYYRLLEWIIKSHFTKDLSLDKYLDNPAKFLSRTDLSYEELINKIDSIEFENTFLINMLGNIAESFQLIHLLKAHLKHEIHKAVGRYIYVASFSKRNNNPLMWSHYADNHKGFCLIYKPYNNSLYIDPLKNVDQNGRQLEIKKKFEFKPIIYTNRIKALDGFLNFNQYIYGDVVVSKKVIGKNWMEYSKSARIKFRDWKYEEEYRLINDSNWLVDFATENGVKKLSSVERIFYYNQTQFRGIIFGSKMNENDKEEILNAVYKMRDDLVHYKGCNLLPIFLFYNAVQKPMEFVVEPELVFGLGCSNEKFNKDKLNEKVNEFERLLAFYKKQNNKPDYYNI